MNILRNKSTRRLLIFVFVFVQASYIYMIRPKPIQMAALTTASTTLGNSRLSYKAGISGVESIGSTVIDIDASGNPDNDTDHLFINDDICFSNTV
ncbi:hypothetical protein KBD09_04110, partial [Candidatus Woesebacteria bacterium]|nr:hypothetical protein [Candidatus Woesebacteria bacterium]